MPKHISEEDLRAIEEAARRHPDGVTAQQIGSELSASIPLRTLQYRLKYLADNNRLVKEGDGRWAKYRTPAAGEGRPGVSPDAQSGGRAELHIPLSKKGAGIQKLIRQPPGKRTPAGYNRQFLDSYRPNVSSYLSPGELKHLWNVGKPKIAEQAAGTYAKQILNRLLIDLSWNSSRLEGNTYSLLDTKRLIDFGETAEGKDRFEAQMIMNHKDAIEFLVTAAEEIGFNRYTILNLHALLANNLLADTAAAGKLRQIVVGIEKSVYHPLEVPQLIEECFNQILATAAAINDPFEQSFFVMVQLPYLQPFDDVNKRVSRLAANIPFIKGNLSPLSFTDVPLSTYTEAVLGVYELNAADLLKDVFVWAYERSAARYAAVRQSLGEPDPFRLRHRSALHEIVRTIISGPMNKKSAAAHIAAWTEDNIEPADRARFRELAEDELFGLHEGNFARYQIRPSEFKAWQEVWAADAQR